MKQNFFRNPSVLLLFALSFSLSGCGTLGSSLIGSADPVETKSELYGIMQLDKVYSDWKKIDSGFNDNIQTQIPDSTYQNIRSSSIISINSVCQSEILKKKDPLKSATDLLFLGMNNIKHRKEERLTLSGYPAISTLIEGQMDGVQTKIKSIIVQKNDCIYDLMQISNPNDFDSDHAVFSEFISSLRLD
jgi:hypothetical protein